MTKAGAAMASSTAASNPVLAEWGGPYGGAPPFDRIKDGDYQPAIEAGMAEQRKVSKGDDFVQAGEFYRGLSKIEQDHLIKNLAADLAEKFSR